MKQAMEIVTARISFPPVMTAFGQCGLCGAPVNRGTRALAAAYGWLARAEGDGAAALHASRGCRRWPAAMFVMLEAPVHLDRPPDAMDFVFYAFQFAGEFVIARIRLTLMSICECGCLAN
jgi:hypothetical protein